MNLVIAFTAIGPTLGALAWLLHWPWLFWVGALLCAVSLALDIGSGTTKLPVLPAMLMAIGAGALSPWWFGAAAGLMGWTTFEVAGMLVNRLRLARGRPDL